jgi:hypothetical protein
MEKKMTVRFLWVTFLTLTTSVIGSTAQQKPITVPEKSALSIPASEKSHLERFFGTIEEVNELRTTINIKGKVKKEEKTLTFGINDRTKITRGKTELNMANLKHGMYVLVEYKKEGEKLIAAAIKVSGPK